MSSARAQASVTKGHLVVIGGGFGGATLARFAKRLLPQLSVMLIEPNSSYVACPFSNLVIAGHRDLVAQSFNYSAVTRDGVELAQEKAVDVDVASREVLLQNGSRVNYDRLVVSPGIDFRWNTLDGYDAAAAERMPHAWKAGTQTLLLRDQLQAMKNGGVVVMSVTAAPFRCPPGPYERASLIADYLQRTKPKSKLILLDSNERFSKQPLFLQAWRARFGALLEWRNPSNDGRVTRVDSTSRTLYTDFDELRADVVNVVPPQWAGEIARRMGVADESGWCPINAIDFTSTLQPNVHVIGDATIAAPMPKSAFAANVQAKVCAIQLARHFTQLDVEPTTLANTCYSFLNEREAISVSGVYRTDGGRFTNVADAGGISPLEGDQALKHREAAAARDWFRAITQEAFL